MSKSNASLLAKALAVAVAKSRTTMQVSDEMLELALAYARHEVSAPQIAKVLGITQSKVESRMNSALKSGVRHGKLVLR